MVGESGVAAKHTRRRTLAPSWRLFARTNRHFSSAFSSPRIARVPPRSPHTDGRDAAPRVRRVGPRVRARALPPRTSRCHARTPLRVRSNPRPPDRSPSDEPAAPHRVFPPFAVAAGPRPPTDVIPNKFVAANGAAREVLEKGFRFTPRNLGIFAVFGIAVPVLIYKGCVDEFVRAQDSLRDELSSDSPGPVFFPRRGSANDSLPERPHGKTRLTAFRSLAKCRPDPEQRYTDKKYGRPEKKFM